MSYPFFNIVFKSAFNRTIVELKLTMLHINGELGGLLIVP